MSKRIVLGDVENGELANTDAEWSIDESGQLVLDIPESGAYDMSGVDLKGLQSLSTGKGRITGEETITLNVPTDFATMDDAVSAASEYLTPQEGVDVIVNIETGHTVESQVLLENGDYSNIRVTSEDEEVSIDQTAITQSFGDLHDTFLSGGTDRKPVFGAINASLPIIDAQFKMGDSEWDIDEIKDGILLNRGSRAYLTRGSGVRNAAATGLYINAGSMAVAHGTDFSGAGNCGTLTVDGSYLTAWEANFSDTQISDPGFDDGNGIFANSNSSVVARGVVASNCSGHAIRASRNAFVTAVRSSMGGGGSVADLSNAGGSGRGAIAAVDGSIIDASGADITNSGDNGAFAQFNATVIISSADVSGAAENGAQGRRRSNIEATSLIANDVGNSGIRAEGACVVNAEGLTATNAGTNGIDIRGASTCQARDADVSDAGDKAVFVTAGSFFSGFEMTGVAATGRAVDAANGSWLFIGSSNFSGAGQSGIVARAGSTVNAKSADVSGASSNGIDAEERSKIDFEDGDASNTGNTNVSLSQGSSANLTGADMTGRSSGNGISANTGSLVGGMFGADCRIAEAEDNGDIQVSNGSIIAANGADGGTNVTVNDISSNGIIFK